MEELDLASLQDALATIDMWTQPAGNVPSGWPELLLFKKDKLGFRMDGNNNHRRPHFHVDYGRKYHVASYAIDTTERLAGNLAHKYDKAVRSWAQANRKKLQDAWDAIKSGKQPETSKWLPASS